MKVAVIGTGKLGQRHLTNWTKISGAEIVGVVARNKERLSQVASAFGTNGYESIQQLLSQTDVDVIDICTPTYTHPELVIEAANAKKHIICEKPLALNADEAKKMIDVCKRNNVQLLVAHTLRFFPAYAQAHNQIKGGAIGKPGVIRMKRGVPYPAANTWYEDEAKSGGVFVDLGIHELDWLLWTFGDVKRVMAKRVKRSNLEYGFITLKMSDGVIVHVELSWAEASFRSSFELSGDKGMITFNHDESEPLKIELREVQHDVNTLRSVMKKDPYERELEHFLKCIAGEETPIITAEEALKAIEVANAANESVHTGQPVILGGGM